MYELVVVANSEQSNGTEVVDVGVEDEGVTLRHIVRYIDFSLSNFELEVINPVLKCLHRTNSIRDHLIHLFSLLSWTLSSSLCTQKRHSTVHISTGHAQ